MLNREHTLSGVQVVELSHDTGAAFGGQLLSGQGADVTRVILSGRVPATQAESVAVSRRLSASDVSTDRFKTRVVLEGDAAARKARLADLLATADVFITDVEAGELRALGLHWNDLRGAHPRLVYAHLSVFGVKGPKAGWRGGDLEAQAYSGVAGQLGAESSAPIVMPYNGGLMHGGLHAAAAVAAGLFSRSLSGHGSFIDVSAAQALATDVRNYSLMMRYYGLPLKRSGRRPQGSLGRYPTAIFPCKDGYVVLTARSGEQYRNFLAMMGNPKWAEDPRFQDAYALAMQHADEVDGLVIPWLMNYTRSQLVAMGIEHKFPVGPLLTLDEVLEDEQYRFRDFFGSTDVDGMNYVLPNNPALVSHANPPAAADAQPA